MSFAPDYHGFRSLDLLRLPELVDLAPVAVWPDDEKQPRTQEPFTPSESENTVTIKRPRAGSVVILAPAGTVLSWIGTENYTKVVMWPATGD